IAAFGTSTFTFTHTTPRTDRVARTPLSPSAGCSRLTSETPPRMSFRGPEWHHAPVDTGGRPPHARLQRHTWRRAQSVRRLQSRAQAVLRGGLALDAVTAVWRAGRVRRA